MNLVVFTDLDGTLLDHQSYRFEAALPALAALQQSGVPVIPVTSKTRAEVEPLRDQLGLFSPFITENGSAVFIPKAQYDKPQEAGIEESSNYWVKAFAPAKSYWASVIEPLLVTLPNAFTPFSALSSPEICKLTGLTPKQADLAATRDYSDPLHWFGSDVDFEQLRHACAGKDIQVVRGGRFVHLIKGADKGKAMRWTHQWLSNLSAEPLFSVALGDGENDLAMLETADYPVQIRSPAHPLPPFDHPHLYRSNRPGPAGWSEAIHHLIEKLPYT